MLAFVSYSILGLSVFIQYRFAGSAANYLTVRRRGLQRIFLTITLLLMLVDLRQIFSDGFDIQARWHLQ